MTDQRNLPHEHFQEKTTTFLRDLATRSAAIRMIYEYDPAHEDIPANTTRDILLEKVNSPVKGIINKFNGRILILLSYTCLANCRYCERQDRVGVGLDSEGRLTGEDIRSIGAYIASTPEITEVILSGGDPLTHPSGLRQMCAMLAAISHVRIVRIHTRVPVQNPAMIDMPLLEEIIRPFPTFYFSIHIDHPDELTSEAEACLLAVRRLGYILLGQSVFLRGVNDDVDTLARLFTRMAELGIRPYYIYHCQAIPTTMRFVMRLEDEVKIMTSLRERLSGVAFPSHVIDIQHTKGKVIVPTEHWSVDFAHVRDFLGTWLPVESQLMQPLEP